MVNYAARAILTKSVALGLFAAVAVPATANAGFFDDLFGGIRQTPIETPQLSNPLSVPSDIAAPHDLQRARNSAVDEKPVLQKTTDLWHDKTLRYGDAVMMKDGLHVYSGPEGSRHRLTEFTRLSATRDLSPKAKLALIAMDTSRNDPSNSSVARDTIVSGRSAAVGSAIVAGYRITDAKGRSVRYVGP